MMRKSDLAYKTSLTRISKKSFEVVGGHGKHPLIFWPHMDIYRFTLSAQTRKLSGI